MIKKQKKIMQEFTKKSHLSGDYKNQAVKIQTKYNLSDEDWLDIMYLAMEGKI